MKINIFFTFFYLDHTRYKSANRSKKCPFAKSLALLTICVTLATAFSELSPLSTQKLLYFLKYLLQTLYHQQHDVWQDSSKHYLSVYLLLYKTLMMLPLAIQTQLFTPFACIMCFHFIWMLLLLEHKEYLFMNVSIMKICKTIYNLLQAMSTVSQNKCEVLTPVRQSLADKTPGSGIESCFCVDTSIIYI